MSNLTVVIRCPNESGEAKAREVIFEELSQWPSPKNPVFPGCAIFGIHTGNMMEERDIYWDYSDYLWCYITSGCKDKVLTLEEWKKSGKPSLR